MRSIRSTGTEWRRIAGPRRLSSARMPRRNGPPPSAPTPVHPSRLSRIVGRPTGRVNRVPLVTDATRPARPRNGSVGCSQSTRQPLTPRLLVRSRIPSGLRSLHRRLRPGRESLRSVPVAGFWIWRMRQGYSRFTHRPFLSRPFRRSPDFRISNRSHPLTIQRRADRLARAGRSDPPPVMDGFRRAGFRPPAQCGRGTRSGRTDLMSTGLVR